MTPNKLVSREEWVAARKALLADEKAATHARDAVAKKRCEMPWVKIDQNYVFESVDGKKSLADLFGPRSQLFVYHFMLSPESNHLCPGCSFLCDHVDSARQHFEHGDLAFAAITRGRVDQIEAAKKRLGWQFTFVSSLKNSFNFDFNVSFTPEQQKSGVYYNFEKDKPKEVEKIKGTLELPGFSLFYKDEAGTIYHTYSGYARAGDIVLNAYNFLDHAPKGRNETSTMNWMKFHDEYEGAKAAACCH